MMSPPASDSGSSPPQQFSPYCVDSEPGTPSMDHDPVTDSHRSVRQSGVTQQLWTQTPAVQR